MEEEYSYITTLPTDFPLEDVEAIAERLLDAAALVPGYIPPDVGVLSLSAIFYAQDVEQIETMVLPDRNLVTRMATVARGGVGRTVKKPTSLAMDLMAFSQAVNFGIEPSISFHELAHRKGNDVALEELSWFRVADHGQAHAWIEMAQGRLSHLPIVAPPKLEDHELSYPLNRWKRNYIIALKIAELELEAQSHLTRVIALLEWMERDFIFAGPAAIFAAMYFGPRANRSGLIKQLRSKDRTRAIAGVRNAAWDITHLSDFVKRIFEHGNSRQSYIFATADRNLGEIAKALVSHSDSREKWCTEFGTWLAKYWPAGDAQKVSEAFFSHLDGTGGRAPPGPKAPLFLSLDDMITKGEALICSWGDATADISSIE